MITKIRNGSEEEYARLLLASKNERNAKQKKRIRKNKNSSGSNSKYKKNF